MAEIVLKFDTVTKAAVVTVDGEELTDLSSLSMYPQYCYDSYDSVDSNSTKKFSLTVTTSSKDTDKSLKTYTSLTASKKGLDKPEDRAAALSEGIADYFKKSKP